MTSESARGETPPCGLLSGATGSAAPPHAALPQASCAHIEGNYGLSNATLAVTYPGSSILREDWRAVLQLSPLSDTMVASRVDSRMPVTSTSHCVVLIQAELLRNQPFVLLPAERDSRPSAPWKAYVHSASRRATTQTRLGCSSLTLPIPRDPLALTRQ